MTEEARFEAVMQAEDPRRQDEAWAGVGQRRERVGRPPSTHGELYVSRPTMGLIMGVSVSTIDRMVASGMPSVTWGRRTRRFLPSRALAWAAEEARS